MQPLCGEIIPVQPHYCSQQYERHRNVFFWCQSLESKRKVFFLHFFFVPIWSKEKLSYMSGSVCFSEGQLGCSCQCRDVFYVGRPLTSYTATVEGWDMESRMKRGSPQTWHSRCLLGYKKTSCSSVSIILSVAVHMWLCIFFFLKFIFLYLLAKGARPSSFIIVWNLMTQTVRSTLLALFNTW